MKSGAKQKLSDIARAIIDLEIEKSKLNREKSMLVLNKSLLLYFTFLFTAVVGFVGDYIDKSLFNILILMGLCVLIIGIIPYIKTMRHEESNIDELIKTLKEGKE
ncbi:MAG: hypothetical protein Q8O89_08310 [Nanoarchaeota archaeon]|nr:hypothetical protein [Nanoarchaeota archaeon]